MTVFFLVLALVVVVSAVGVVGFRNPINSALSLVANLLAVAGLFAMLDAHFLATVQIIVYAGAIMVLFLFVIMLLNIKIEAVRPLGFLMMSFCVVIGAIFIGLLVVLFKEGFGSVSEASVPVEGTVANLGMLLYTEYVFTFEAASLLIIAAIVGAVMLAKRRAAGLALEGRTTVGGSKGTP